MMQAAPAPSEQVAMRRLQKIVATTLPRPVAWVVTFLHAGSVGVQNNIAVYTIICQKYIKKTQTKIQTIYKQIYPTIPNKYQIYTDIYKYIQIYTNIYKYIQDVYKIADVGGADRPGPSRRHLLRAGPGRAGRPRHRLVFCIHILCIF